jgi:Lar family restriction alleviation protein
MSDLKPCPFCGSTDISQDDCSEPHYNGTSITCDECGAQVKGWGASNCTERARALWNRRAEADAALALLRYISDKGYVKDKITYDGTGLEDRINALLESKP